MDKKKKEIAKKLYIYAYPIVWTSQIMLKPKEQYMNLFHYRTLVKAKEKMYKPNNDTLYSTASFQLKSSPYVVEVPEINDRYLLVNSFNTKTEVYFSTGSKAENNGAGKYLFLYQDEPVPKGYEDCVIVRSEDSRNILMLRIENYGEDDLSKANAYQDQFKFYPVFPERIKDLGNVKVDNFIRYIEELPPEDYIGAFIRALDDTKVASRSIQWLHELGINEKNYAKEQLSQEFKNELKDAFQEALGEIKAYDGEEGTHSNGWYSVTKNVGNYGDNDLFRAFVTWFAYGANLPEDSIYPVLYQDDQGEILHSDSEYVIHFEKDELPHAKYFWSIGWYSEPDGFVADNELERYVINSHMSDNFKYNKDGSIDFFISKQPPEEEEFIGNWLPAEKIAQIFHF